ncbi:VTT domain-containing protein [Streptomyces sp. NPDC052644]|uniref:DedA family protein n=1 Tax=Streptomyces sp. NPDC095602 TaxID=3155819 RepID=UPI00332269E5
MDCSYWFYVLLVLATAPPMVPNSALLAGAGAVAAAGGLSLPLLLLVPLTSAVLGDLVVFSLGRRSRGRALAWLSRDARRRSMLEWVSHRIHRYGIPAVIAVRFVPTGRGVGGLTAGVVGFPLRSYLIGAGIAETLFVSYTVGLGYLGGRLVTGCGPAPLLVGPAVSLLVAAVALGVQRRSGRRLGRAER